MSKQKITVSLKLLWFCSLFGFLLYYVIIFFDILSRGCSILAETNPFVLGTEIGLLIFSLVYLSHNYIQFLRGVSK